MDRRKIFFVTLKGEDILYMGDSRARAEEAALADGNDDVNVLTSDGYVKNGKLQFPSDLTFLADGDGVPF